MRHTTEAMTDLATHSVALIHAHQHANGAYVASPNFATYAYSWLRDGSFIAHAMDRVGAHESAARFHRWVGMVLARHDAKLADLTARQQAGETIPLEEQMHCRFTLEGDEGTAAWTNFQLDGYGTWLWALAGHVERTGERALLDALRPQIERLVAYLRASWGVPCFDCWEEFGDKVHTATLAALYGGLRAIGRVEPALADETPDAIRAFVLERCVVEGRLAKFVGSTLVDANLLGALAPYGLLAPEDPVWRATLARIESDLLERGVRRYVDDTYYGGGEWVLLAGWLGWAYAASGEPAHAVPLLGWIEAQADGHGDLPEQVTDRPLAPAFVQHWEERWGPVAKPLLWSHAMYLILNDLLASESLTNESTAA